MFSLPDVQASAQIPKTVSRQSSIQSNYIASSSLFYVPPTYFTRHLHLLTLQSILENSLQRETWKGEDFFFYECEAVYIREFQVQKWNPFEAKQVCKTTVLLPHFLPNLEPLYFQHYSGFVLPQIRLKKRICLVLPFSFLFFSFLCPLSLPAFFLFILL